MDCQKRSPDPTIVDLASSVHDDSNNNNIVSSGGDTNIKSTSYNIIHDNDDELSNGLSKIMTPVADSAVSQVDQTTINDIVV